MQREVIEFEASLPKDCKSFLIYWGIELSEIQAKCR